MSRELKTREEAKEVYDRHGSRMVRPPANNKKTHSRKTPSSGGENNESRRPAKLLPSMKNQLSIVNFMSTANPSVVIATATEPAVSAEATNDNVVAESEDVGVIDLCDSDY